MNARPPDCGRNSAVECQLPKLDVAGSNPVARFFTSLSKPAMPYYEFLWTDDIIAHLEEHGVSREDYEKVVSNPRRLSVSRSSGRPCCWGETADGRHLFCVYEFLDDMTIVPVTAYEVSE